MASRFIENVRPFNARIMPVHNLNHILPDVNYLFPARIDIIGTYWDKQVGDFSLITSPRLSILSSTLVNIPLGAMDNHNHEEKERKPRKWASNNGTLAINADIFMSEK